ncbi:tubulin-like doman-containing protein [Cylindrospermopsis raciborskii]|uniref:tubulin-like doman-containing protein n=1 Tax=Cylindrospermopsis raciborskii TaxID=77022 RepID=UPI0022C341DE|nr:tubulin-like doman-containing protein [Cylindrospermopsis raciborskii]MCZ2207342.1 tubulin-like doman-containing protein [Cylindrospermopsis raciborskii PAMP2011]
MAAVEEKSMVPTVMVGVGGTGVEVLSRVRRLVEESYGSLKKFPLISFMSIDTDKDYKVSNPEAAGSPLQDHEKYWASVSGREVGDIMSNMTKYPWIESWFPRELERNIGALEAGAGQIRACGRFAFFYNYHQIKERLNEACDRVKGHETLMLDEYGIRVNTNGLNVFIVGSLSGGTGSGIILDLGYCIRNWLKGQGSPLITAIVPMPNAFASIKVGDRVLANGYAALMELSYFSDYRTEYVAQFSGGLVDEVRDKRPPFDFTYLVGTKNGEAEFKLDQIREMIAQNIFLDLTSDFAPHKRSIRDNIKGAWAQTDPGGRGYPKNFMSFGLATIEIPVAQIRASLGNRLAVDLVSWWLNESVPLPPNMVELLQTDILKRKRLTEAELLVDLASANDKSLISEIAGWVNSIRNEIATDNKLQCTYQGANLLGPERGKILQFVDYLQPKVEEYRAYHLRELSPDERAHGDFLQKMYDNRNRIIQQGRNALEAELYSIIRDRNRGPKFADAFIVNVHQLLANSAEKFRRESEKTWQPNEINRQRQYEAALQEINQFKNSFGLTKQSQIEKHCEDALSGIEASAVALIQRKARALGLEVIARLQEHLERLEQRLARLNQKLQQLRDDFKQAADREAESADALKINGVKLYNREELNLLYQDAIERLAGTSLGNQSRYELGLNQVCSTMTEDILKDASPLWKQTRQVDEVMQLFDITQLPDVNCGDFKDKIAERTRLVVQQAPDESQLKRELAACDRLFKVLQNDPEAIRNNIRIVYQKSQPFILLSQAVLTAADAGFMPALNTKVAILGGRNTINPAAIKVLPFLQERVGSADALTPLGDQERHRIVFVQEIGGFSLRCISGMRELQQSYQDWKGQAIEAKRAKLRGESRDLPIPVHIQKEPPFWDLFPEDPEVFRLVLQARALGVLRLEENRGTQEKVIRYTHKNVIGAENVDIAASWEEAVQVLEVLACRPDREEIHKQVSAKFSAADQPQLKQALYDQLITYLKQREADLEKLGGADNPDYKREATIIQDVIKSHKLKNSEDSDESFVNPKQQTKTQPHLAERHIGFNIDSSDSSSQAKYQQYLAQLWNLDVPQEAFVTTAKAKASELKLDLQKAEAIWNKFINPPVISPQETEYEQYLSQLSTFDLPKDAFIASAEAKSLELGLDRAKAEAIWHKFV